MDDYGADHPPEHVHDQFQRPGPGDPIKPPIQKEGVSWWGWAILACLLTLLIGGELKSYLTRDEGKPNYNNEEHGISFEVGRQKKGLKSPIVDPDPIPDKVKANHLTDPNAALIWGIYRDLAGKPVKPEEVRPLKGSKDKADRVAFAVLTTKTLTHDQAYQYRRALGEGEAAEYLGLRAEEKAGEKVDWSGYTQKTDALTILVGVGVAVSLAGAVAFLIYFVLRANGKLLPLGHPALPISLRESDAYAMRAALLLVMIMFVPALPALAAPFPGATAVGGLLLVATVLAVSQIRSADYRLNRWIRPGGIKGIRAAGAGAIGYAMGAPIIAVMAVAGPWIFRGLPDPEHPVTQAMGAATPIQLIGIFVSAVIAAPICEEICFRGTILPAMHRLTGSPIWAILITNLLFAMIHPTGIPAWPALATVGAVASLVTYQTGSLYPAMIIHAIHNGVTLALGLLILR
jgi:membrane protease YdiL (CAAX protease family)